MFIDIWDKDNKAIKINKFSKDLNSSDVKKYENALREIYNKYGIQQFASGHINVTKYKIEFKNSDEYGFNQYLYFTTLIDCYLFLDSDTFSCLFESEDIDFIQITAGKQVMFKYDNKG